MSGPETWDMVFPWAIRVAATLRLADLIAAGFTGLDELAAQAGADPDALRRLLRYLACRGVFREEPDGRFALTRPARMLRERGPAGPRALLDLDGLGGRLDRSFAGLLDTVRTGRPAYAAVFGRPFWSDLAGHPELGAGFDAMMATQVAQVVPEVVGGYPWPATGHLVDVGGGTGTLLTALLGAHRGLRGTLVDLPGPAEAARQALADAGLAARCAVVPGSFFDPLPPGGDLYLLSVVIHDWNDADARLILRQCARAAAPAGRVLVIEGLADGDLESTVSTDLDLRMLVTMGGRERSLPDMLTLIESAGLAVAAIRRTGARSLIECVPA
jgi:SAM-dependent methyltransferase